MIRAVWVSQDDIFCELASLYEPDLAPSKPIEEELEVNSDDDIRPRPLPKDTPSSTELSGPHDSTSDPNTSWPSLKLDKGKGKIPKYKVDHPDNSDSDVSECSLDSEFGVPIMWTPRVEKALTSANEKL